MLSPKMQRSVRVNENQLIMLSDKAQYDHSMVSVFLSNSFLHLLHKSCKPSINRFVLHCIYNQARK